MTSSSTREWLLMSRQLRAEREITRARELRTRELQELLRTAAHLDELVAETAQIRAEEEAQDLRIDRLEERFTRWHRDTSADQQREAALLLQLLGELSDDEAQQLLRRLTSTYEGKHSTNLAARGFEGRQQ
ncbi:hypothetical protein PHYPSEUDO_006403 [Phytophthora pseudosyringae]|uniref:Uncharacterized protein n=1 Tax=Phytophthora pseudosyringae TaxID=221518 RepID=A0A8T1WH01_9STRA|nr:hypothetical protein PHYPSEUDO_006403 [Phytophthora pseudosyringae]